MEILERFITYLCGQFNNDEQIERQLKEGNVTHPKAKHINGICNSKIQNLPESFKGYFVIEESYYQVGERTQVLPHLFLFDLNEEGKVKLTSYELPEGMSKEDFRNDNHELTMDYNELRISEKFNPMVYDFNHDYFEGSSISDFGNGMTFTLKEKMTSTELEVSEVFRRGGKITFGFEEPIVYKRQS